MIAIAGHWEIGYMTPIEEANLINLVLRDFEVSTWFMCPVSGIKHNEERLIDLREHHTFADIFQGAGDMKRVFVEPRTKHQNPDTIWLHEYSHPQDCLYVFGSAHKNPTIAHKRGQDDVVSIKTVQDKGVLWANQCIALVLYDRMVKSWL